MKAIFCEKYGEPENLVLKDTDILIPACDEVVVAVEAAGVNFPDVLMIQNKYQIKPNLPFIPGGEVAGKILSTGTEVDKFRVGDSVIAISSFGGFGEQMLVNENAVLLRPHEMESRIAAGFCVTYGTAMHALKQRANLRPGETLLVLGAGGGVGLAAVQIGKAMGAEVIAAASSKEKLIQAKKDGADEVINYSNESLRLRLDKIVGKDGVDVVFDPVGGDLTEKALRSTGWGGRVLIIGFASGEISRLPLNLPLLKGSSLVGAYWGSFRQRNVDADNENLIELFDFYSNGLVNPHVSAFLPLSETGKALRILMDRKAIGKVIIYNDQAE